MMSAFRSSRRKVVLWLAAFAVLFFILCSEDVQHILYFRRRGAGNGTASGQYVIDTAGCRIPYLELEDEEITSLYEDVSGYRCSKVPPLVESNLTALYVNAAALPGYGLATDHQVDCSYKPFWRRPPADPTEDDAQVEYGQPVRFRGSVNVTDEFVRVECTANGYKYTDYHSFVPLKPTRVDAERRAGDQALNVLIIGIDSLSRVHLHRKMPKTVEYLTRELGAIEYMGYNKVSDNTFPNLMPMLTGYTFDELVRGCWPSYAARFDNCSFVWGNYSRRGYVTSFGEEQSSFGLFNFLKKGWVAQPTDYYWDTLDLEALRELGHWYDLFRRYPVCMGPRPMYRALLRAAEKFVWTMAGARRRFFAFYWDTSLAHNHIDTASLADGEYVEHLRRLRDSGALDDTLVLFMSDHGHRFGALAQTHQGRLEDRLPFAFWLLPKRFERAWPKAARNLRRNARRLTTTHDVHATLNHALDLQELGDVRLVAGGEADARAVSLFRAVSGERTCDQAGIPAHYCTCQQPLPVDVEDATVALAAAFTVERLNALLAAHPQCAELALERVTRAGLSTYGDAYHAKGRTVSDYAVTLLATPGGGLFDATVRCTKCRGDDFRLTATVDRLDRYGNQSHCVDDFTLRLYCYCRDRLR